MKGILFVTASTLAIVAGVSAQAADMYGSIKDGPVVEQVAVSTRSGFTVTGVLGYSWGDRDISQTVTREAGFYKDKKAPVQADYDENNDGTLSPAEQAEFDEDTKKFNAFIDAALAKYPGSAYDGSTLTIPLLGDIISNAGNGDADGFVYGAEVSYMFHGGGRFALEPAIGVTLYGDNESSISHTNKFGTSTGPLFPNQPVPSDIPELGQTGGASVERNMDIDLLLRGNYFMNDRFALTLAGGASIAFADVCGHNRTDAVLGNPAQQAAVNAAFNTSSCDEDINVGPMVEFGFKWWATDRLAVVGRLDAKWHEFENNSSSSAKLPFREGGTKGLYGESHNSVEAEDMLWTGKLGLSYTFN